MSRFLLVVVVCLAAGGSVLRADEVFFKNGDHLTGTVDSLDGGKLTVNSTVAGKVTVDIKDVRTFTTAGPVEVHLSDGTVTRQPIAAGADGEVLLAPAGGAGARNVLISSIGQLNPPPPHWSGRVTLGGMLARGNTNTDTLNFALNTVRRGQDDRLTLGAGYIFGREHINGTHGKHETANDLFGEAKYDYFFTKKVYGYANIRAEHDTIAGLDLRLTPGVGVGYQWIETPGLSFNTEGGLSYIHRSYSHDGSDDAIAARAAYHLTGKFNDRVSFFHNFEYYPGLDRIDNYFFDTDAGIRTSLTQKMFAEFKVDYRYDAKPAPGHGSNDIRYLVGVGWNF